MALWGNQDQANNAPKFVVSANNGQTGVQQFGNTVFAANPAEVAATPASFHAGWVRITEGTGGRAGRILYETLVAMSTIAGDAMGNSAPANTSGTADDTALPDA